MTADSRPGARFPAVNLLAHAGGDAAGSRPKRRAAAAAALVVVAVLVWGLALLAVATLLGWHAPLALLGRL